jgi:hypothetical protein
MWLKFSRYEIAAKFYSKVRNFFSLKNICHSKESIRNKFGDFNKGK